MPATESAPHPLALSEESLPLWRRAVTPLILTAGRVSARGEGPEFDGEAIEYVVGKYNITPITERSIELGIVKAALPASGKVLEVGNVWGHYFERSHTVVDKFEVAPGVTNSDFMDLDENEKYDFIFSISTFEHIGWDDDVREPEKLGAAFEKLPRLIAPGGTALITVPIDWNEWLDARLAEDATGATSVDWYLRDGQLCSWRRAEKAETLAAKYGSPYRFANGLAVLRFTA